MSLLRNALSGYPQSIADTAILQGVSGRTHEFEIHHLGSWFYAYPGVYAVLRETKAYLYDVLYIGEGVDLDERIGEGRAAHHKWSECVHERATHVGLLVVGGHRNHRLAIETDLRHYYRPPLNDQ